MSEKNPLISKNMKNIGYFSNGRIYNDVWSFETYLSLSFFLSLYTYMRIQYLFLFNKYQIDIYYKNKILTI